MVIPLEEPEFSAGGLLLPDNRRRMRANEGFIIELPEQIANDQNNPFRLGDKITWEQSAEFGIETEGEKFLLVNASSVLMRLPAPTPPTPAAE